MVIPPGCPDGGVQRQRGPGAGVVFGLDSVVEPGCWPRGFCCANEAMRSVLFPSGQLSHSHQLGRAGHTGSVESTSVCHQSRAAEQANTKI